MDFPELFNERILHAQETHNTSLLLVSELTAVFQNSVDGLDGFPPAIVSTGFITAHKKLHRHIISFADEICMKITQLPDDSSFDSIEVPGLISSGWLVKACHDSVTQLQIFMERFSEKCVAFVPVETDVVYQFSEFRRRIDILLRIASAMENLLSYLEHADLAQVKFSAAALELHATDYANAMGARDEAFLDDLSFAVSMVHKIVAERRRMMALRRGRDVTYSPLPARFLVSSPSRKRVSSLDEHAVDEDDCHAFQLETVILQQIIC